MAFIEKLLRDMTLEEKIGQLTMGCRRRGRSFGPGHRTPSCSVTFAPGGLGSLVGAHGVATTTRLQRVALEETRLRIPLIFGFDVLHGYRSIFPVPLGRGGGVRSGLVGAHGANGGLRDAGRRRHADVRADARRHARSALGTHRRVAGRRSVARGAHSRARRCAASRDRTSAGPIRSPRPPSTSAPTAR